MFDRRYREGFESFGEARQKMDELSKIKYNNSVITDPLSGEDTNELRFQTVKIWTWAAVYADQREQFFKNQGLPQDKIDEEIQIIA